jgi:hypothetical protein
MIKKKWLWTFIVPALICAFLLAGCPTEDKGPPPDIWTEVQSVDELIGTWEGSSTYMVPEIPLGIATIPATPVDYTVLAEIDEAEGRFTVTVDFNNYLSKAVGNSQKPAMWGLMKASYSEMLANPPEGMTVTIEDNYRIIMVSDPVPVSEMFIEEDTQFFINQDKTKLKGIVAMPTTEEKQEIILRKK